MSRVPQPHGAIHAAGGQGVPVGTKRHHRDKGGLTGQRARPAGRVAQGSVRFHNRMVSSALPEARMCPSGLNATLITPLVWPVRGWPSAAGLRRVGEVPQPDGGIDAAGGQGVPVGAKRHTDHRRRCGRSEARLAGRVRRVGEIPQPHGVIDAAGGQDVPVGAKRHTHHDRRYGRSEAGPEAPGAPGR